MDEYELDDRECYNCQHCPTHYRECDEIGCCNGLIDMSEEDPLNYAPGEEFENCPQCKGAGVEWWCPACGTDLAKYQLDLETL